MKRKMTLEFYKDNEDTSHSSDDSDSFLDVLIDFCNSTNSVDQCNTTISCSDAPLPPTKKKKKGKRPSNNPSYMPALRILRTDIRRKYGVMLNTVVNSHDLELLGKFFHEFAHPQFSIQDEGNVPPELPLPVFDNVRGVDSVLHHFSLLQNHFPDAIYQYSNVKVCKTLGAFGSRVVADLYMSATIFPFTNSFPQLQFPPFLQKNLDEVIAMGILTLFLDENHRIVSIQLSSMQFLTRRVHLLSS